MTPDQIALVQSSFENVKPIAEKAAELFYNRLFELDPSIRPLFKGDMQEQGRKLMGVLATAVSGLQNLDKLVPVVQDLGRRHKTYGVIDSHYATVAQALLWTLEQGLGDAFTEETKTAWTEAYNTLAKVMQNAASIAA